MSDARVTARLDDKGRNEPALAPVDSTGRTLVLDVPPGVELLRASLTLQAPGDDVMVDVVPGATLATSTGKKQLSKDESIEWVSLDWGARRPLTFLQLQTPADSPASKARLSVAEGGPWYPPTPSNIFPLGGNGQPLPGIMASRLMVELVDATSAADPLKPKVLVPTKLSGVVVKAAARPADLSVLVEPGTLFFHQATPLQPFQELTLVEDLTAALQRAWPAELKGGQVALTLRSSAPAKLTKIHLTLDTATVVQQWSSGGSSLSLPLVRDGEASASIDVPVGQKLKEVRFRVQHQLRDEHLPLTPQPPPEPLLAHRCGSGFAAAQSFSAPVGGGPLVGLDLHLRPLTREVKGTLTLFPDTHDRPGEQLLEGTTLELSLEETGNAPWPYRWAAFELPKPVALDSGWWAVLTVTEGTVLWSLGEPGSAPDEGPLVPRTALYRTEDTSPWLPREVPSPKKGEASGPWAFTRPRLQAPAVLPPPPPRVRLRWGDRSLDVTPDEDGSVFLDEHTLEKLPPPPVTPKPGAPPRLEVVVLSGAGGESTLSGLRVTIPRGDAYPLFPSPTK